MDILVEKLWVYLSLKKWFLSFKFNFSNLVFFIGIIKNGGVKFNIIFFYSELIYYFRVFLMKEFRVLIKKVEECFRVVALVIGCTVRIFES